MGVWLRVFPLDVTPTVPSNLSQCDPKTKAAAVSRDGWRDGSACAMRIRKIERCLFDRLVYFNYLFNFIFTNDRTNHATTYRSKLGDVDIKINFIYVSFFRQQKGYLKTIYRWILKLFTATK